MNRNSTTLLDRVRRYEVFRRPRVANRFAELAAGQAPTTLFITCADSRVVPHLIAPAEPGELFVVRNVANLVHPDGADDSTSSAVWYATEVLNVTDIIVCGHSGCGGMNALIGDRAPEALSRWLAPARASLHVWERWGPYDPSFPQVDQLSQISARHQLDNLRSLAHVRRREGAGTLRLHAWWFDLPTARVLSFDEEAQRFIPAVNALVHEHANRPPKPLDLTREPASRAG